MYYQTFSNTNSSKRKQLFWFKINRKQIKPFKTNPFVFRSNEQKNHLGNDFTKFTKVGEWNFKLSNYMVSGGFTGGGVQGAWVPQFPS